MDIKSKIVIIYFLFPHCDFQRTVKPFAVRYSCNRIPFCHHLGPSFRTRLHRNSKYPSIMQILLHQLVQPVHLLWHCDRCTWPLNQTSDSLVQAPKEVMALAISRPTAPLVPACSLKTHTKDQSDTVSTDAYELGTPIMWLTHEYQAAFPRLIYQGTKKVVGTKSLTHTFPITCNLTMSQPLYSINMTAEVSLLWALPGRQHGCMASISPWAGMLLKVDSRGRETFYQRQIFGKQLTLRVTL